MAELRDELRDMPGWIAALDEEIHGQTRKGSSVRRSTDKGSPALCRLSKHGSFRGSPGQQRVYTHSVLVEWVRDVCETRGVEVPQLDTGDLSLWLARHVTAIAADPGFSVCYREIKQIRSDIERIVDLPQSPRCYGACPTVFDGEQVCGTALVVAPGAKTVECDGCGATRTIEELIRLRLGDPYALYTASEVLLIMASDYLREPVAESTWRRWRASKQVKPAGQLYGEPGYCIEDVREFRRKWTRKRVG